MKILAPHISKTLVLTIIGICVYCHISDHLRFSKDICLYHKICEYCSHLSNVFSSSNKENCWFTATALSRIKFVTLCLCAYLCLCSVKPKVFLKSEKG